MRAACLAVGLMTLLVVITSLSLATVLSIVPSAQWRRGPVPEPAWR